MNAFAERAITRGMRLLARALADGRLQTCVSGLEHIPVQGPGILIARHYHHLFDGLALFAALQRPFHILVTLDWARSWAVRNAMTTLAWLARWPVILRADALSDLRGRSAFSPADILRYQRRGFRESVELLGAGRILVIFPEGYPTIDPHYTRKTGDQEILPFRAGFRTIAVAAEKRYGAKIPLIPVGFRYQAGKKWTAHVAFGTAIRQSDFTGRETLLQHLERDVARLSGLVKPREQVDH